mmetsp:Transcript_52509/g.139822  ORF Transcript_52509/g.139822 Transcript_52509/m.139822 type:complete len:119 (-) Transcript_52509:1906-2262(-)
MLPCRSARQALEASYPANCFVAAHTHRTPTSNDEAVVKNSLKHPRLEKNCGVASSTANTLSSMAFSYLLAAEDVKEDVRFLAQLTLGRLLTLRKVPHLGVVVEPPHSSLCFCVAYVMS